MKRRRTVKTLDLSKRRSNFPQGSKVLFQVASSSSTTLLRAADSGSMVTAGSPRLPDSVGPVASTGLPRVALRPRGGDEDRRVGLIGLTSASHSPPCERAAARNFAARRFENAFGLQYIVTRVTFNRRASKQASNCLLAYRRGQASKWGAGRKQSLGHTTHQYSLQSVRSFSFPQLPVFSPRRPTQADAGRARARRTRARLRARAAISAAGLILFFIYLFLNTFVFGTWSLEPVCAPVLWCAAAHASSHFRQPHCWDLGSGEGVKSSLSFDGLRA